MEKLLPIIRWYVKADLEALLAIWRTYCPSADLESLRAIVDHRSMICRVAEMDDVPVGLAIYELKPTSLMLVNLGVAVAYRRRGVGGELLRKIIACVGGRRHTLWTVVRAGNVVFGDFLRGQRMKVRRVHRGWCQNPREDAFEFRFTRRV